MSDDAKKLAEEMRTKASLIKQDFRLYRAFGFSVAFMESWARRVEALGGEQANEMDRGRLSDDVNSVRSSSGVEADQSSSAPPQPAAPCRCEHPLSDHSQALDALDDVLSVCAAIVDCVTRGRRETGDFVEALEKSSRRLRRALNDTREY